MTAGPNVWALAEANPSSKVREAISLIIGSKVSLGVHYCKRGEVHFTTLL